jgi:hypothetical protein
MKINPTCPVFKVFVNAAGMKISQFEQEKKEKKENPNFRVCDASTNFIQPKESWAQRWIINNR